MRNTLQLSPARLTLFLSTNMVARLRYLRVMLSQRYQPTSGVLVLAVLFALYHFATNNLTKNTLKRYIVQKIILKRTKSPINQCV